MNFFLKFFSHLGIFKVVLLFNYQCSYLLTSLKPFIYQGLQILHCLTQVRDKSIIKSLKKSIFGRKSANFQEEVLDTYQQLTQFIIISNLPVV